MCGALIKSGADTHIVGMCWLFLSDFIGKLKDESQRETEVIPQRTRARHFCDDRLVICPVPIGYRLLFFSLSLFF